MAPSGACPTNCPSDCRHHPSGERAISHSTYYHDSRRTIELEADVMLDLGDDGQPVGYDIQHASTKAEFIARLILDTAAE